MTALFVPTYDPDDWQTCPTCDGACGVPTGVIEPETGHHQLADCDRCEGAGEVPVEECADDLAYRQERDYRAEGGAA